MRLLLRLCVVALLSFLLVALQALADREHWRLPFYFLQQVVLVGLPMAWLLREVIPAEDSAGRMSFLTTSAGFITLASSTELVGIERRFWWFSEDIDRLVHLYVGDIPIEEFLAYPLLLNVSVLFYLHLKRYVPPTPPPAPWSERTRTAVRAVAALLALAGVALLVLAFLHREPALDPAVKPAPDAAGAIRYTAGPPEHGWTVVQLWALAILLLAWERMRPFVDRRRLVLGTAVYLVFAFYVELMACGRGWWVWNSRQVLGLFTWVLPIESYSMYLTGAVLPILAYDRLRPFFAPAAHGTAPATG